MASKAQVTYFPSLSMLLESYFKTVFLNNMG